MFSRLRNVVGGQEISYFYSEDIPVQISTRKGIIVGLAAAAAVIGIVTGTSLSGVHAQVRGNLPEAMNPSAVPYAEFQYATLTGANNTINATRVPIVTAGGTSYQDLTINLEVGANGQVSLGTLTAVASPATQTAGFIAGTYVGPSNVCGGGATITVSGPGVGTGGTTIWTVQSAPGASGCTYPASGYWYVDAPTDSNNPLFARLKTASITSAEYSYGLLGPGGSGGGWFDGGAILGASQSGNSITFVSYSFDVVNDQSTPGGQITYTLQSPAN